MKSLEWGAVQSGDLSGVGVEAKTIRRKAFLGTCNLQSPPARPALAL